MGPGDEDKLLICNGMAQRERRASVLRFQRAPERSRSRLTQLPPCSRYACPFITSTACIIPCAARDEQLQITADACGQRDRNSLPTIQHSPKSRAMNNPMAVRLRVIANQIQPKKYISTGDPDMPTLLPGGR